MFARRRTQKLASAIEPIWRIPIATSPCPVRAWRHHPEVRRSQGCGFGVAQEVYTPRAAARGRPGHASAAIQPAAPHGPSVAAVLPSGLRSGRFGWRRTGSNSLGPRHRPAWSGSPASCVRARGVSRWRHLAGLRRQFRHQTRIHARLIAGYVTVNPRGGSV